jgi:hypothetical protein
MCPSTPLRSLIIRCLITFAVFIGLALTPNLALAQHGGGGGGGSHGGGGGGSRAGGGGGGFHSGGGSYRGGGLSARSYGGGSYSRGGSGSAAGRNPGSSGMRSSIRGSSISSANLRSANLRPAINDGQWHSFGNGASSARFGPTFNRGGSGWRGGWGGYGWRSYGWRGGWGWGGGFGWGLGFGFGWPYWGAYWGPFAWDPWWYYPYGYDPYWYSPWPAYNYYPDDSYNWSTNPPPYRPSDDNRPASYSNASSVADLKVLKTTEPTNAP